MERNEIADKYGIPARIVYWMSDALEEGGGFAADAYDDMIRVCDRHLCDRAKLNAFLDATSPRWRDAL